MRISTAFNHQQRLLGILNDIYRRAEIFCLPSDQIIKEKKERIYEDPGYKRCPGHVKSYLSGFASCLWSKHWNNLKWVLPYKGVNYDGWDDLPEEGKEAYRKDECTGKHVYKKDPTKDY